MESLMQANIFFFITSIAVVVLAILVGIAVYYLIKILKNFKEISDTLKGGVKNAKGEVKKIYKNITNLTK